MFEIPDSLRQKYLQRRQQDVKDCFQKLHQSDWFYFTHLGHQLKGNAASYGYEDLAQIAERMEALAKEKDGTKLFDTLNEFRMWTLKNSRFQSPDTRPRI